jgi:beta-glucosidase
MNNYKYSNKPNLKENAQITRQAAAEGTILLKNNNNTLPYTSKETPLAVFGVTSYNFISERAVMLMKPILFHCWMD